jgi:serine protease Do
VRKIQYLVSLFMILVILGTLSGCALPQIIFKTDSTPASTRIPPTVTVTVPAASAAATPSPGLTTTPSAINPAYTIPAISDGSATALFPNLADVIAKVRPSVVAINTSSTGRSIFGGTFNQEGAGSGWIIDSKGLIVTNNHVVEGAEKITVTLEDGRNFTVETVRTDTTSDLAVLKIDAQDLPAVKIGDSSKARVGDWVIAIGNSLGEGISATKGIVSAKGVSVAADNGETLYDLLQTDAAINPGNSGGPLVNLAGEVIGINSIKVVQVGVEGMGYAISCQTAIPIINELITNGYVARPWLGVKLYQVDAYAINQLDLKVDKGVLLTEVVNGGPANKAGLKKYDVITAFDGQEVNTVKELVKLVRSHKSGDTVQITYSRDTDKFTVPLTLEQAPPPA